MAQDSVLEQYQNLNISVGSLDRFVSELLRNELLLVLFVVDSLPDKIKFQEAIVNSINCGARYFMVWGNWPNDLHDFIDDVMLLNYPLEGEGNNANIMTTAHEDEDVDDVVFFMLNLTGFSRNESHYWVVFLGDGEYKSQMLNYLYHKRITCES